MPETQNVEKCPGCGEPVETGWRLCPACERPLAPPPCPKCGAETKKHWKRCPFCEASLLCTSCGKRLDAGEKCRLCGADEAAERPDILREAAAGIEFVKVAGGTFLMGDSFGDGLENELPLHEVELDEFYIAKYPVTQAQWRALDLENPSQFRGDSRPVERVGFREALDFARRLAEANGGRFRFDLPAEAQWEYAARSGGRKEKYAGGDDPSHVAWYDADSDGATVAVGKKAPNGLQLFDMSGNVWEWCRDSYRDSAYKFHERKNPVGEGDLRDRVIRGGGWNTDAWSARCSRRFGFPSEHFGPALGFRLVLLF